MVYKEELIDVNSAKPKCYMFGDNIEIVIVIETAHASSSGEWWRIAEELSQHAMVIPYDLAGYTRYIDYI